MREASLVLIGLSISSGIGGAILLAANLFIWAALTFMMGSAIAFAGFILILWALRPKRDDDGEEEVVVTEEQEAQPAT